LTLLAGPPKVGKTTLAYHAVVSVALGHPWLGRIVRPSKVLVLGVEEHRRDIVQRFWAVDETALAGRIKIVAGALPFTQEIMQKIVVYIQEEQIGLVLVDTLPFWWGLDDENSAAEVLRAGGLLLKAIRQTQAAWLCNAHTRKSGGDYGSEIRGSSALLGLVDVALSLKRTDTAGNQRILEAVSRYADTPPKLVIGLGVYGYEALGSPEEVGLTAKIEKLRAALTETGQTVKELMAVTSLSKQNVSKCLARLGEPIIKEGTGYKNAPFTYRRQSICPTSNPRGGTFDESNPEPTIRSVAPPVPCDESNSATKEVVLIDAD
jgi:predicted ATP-dependent serine protease